MKRSYLLSLAATVALSACADNPISPEYNATPRSAAVVAAVPARQIVAFKSASGIPAGFAAAVEALGGKVDSELAAIGGAVVSGLSDQAIATLAKRSDVKEVAPEDVIPFNVTAAPLGAAIAEAVPASQAQPQTAAVYAYQWNMRAINAEAAWAAGRLGSSAVTVAILDTGIDYKLPDLTGLVDLARSKSFVPEDDAVVAAVFPTYHPIADLDGHGTNVASQVSSRATYLAGMTSQTTLMGVKVCSLVRNGCPNTAVLNGILYAVDAGAQVINMSLGGGFLKRGQEGYHSLLNRVFQYAEQHGVTVVVSAGNSELDMDHVPNAHFTYCNQTHVICVSATGATESGAGAGPFDDVDQFAFYSNFGRARVDVAAPGGNYVPTADGTSYVTAAWVYSLCSRTKLVLFEGDLYYTNCSAFPTSLYLSGYAGTSQASPHVTGLAALLYAEGVTNPAQVRQRITKGADDLGQPGRDPYYGNGRINVARTLGL